jgi:hypothetical protein
MWLADPATREILPALDSDNVYRASLEEAHRRSIHWRKGWRWGIERDENDKPVALHYWQCHDECCK